MRSLPLGIAAAMFTAGAALAQTTAPATTPTTPGATPPATTASPPATVMPPAGSTTTMSPATPATPRAQLSPANNNSATPPAVTTSQSASKTAAAPVKGRNSFTMGEARRRISAGGFTDVKDLKKDRDGIWRGMAMKDGQSVPVYCDYQGNVGHT